MKKLNTALVVSLIIYGTLSAQVKVTAPPGTNSNTYNISNNADLVTLQAKAGSTVGLHRNVLYYAPEFANITVAKDSAKGKLLWIPWGYSQSGIGLVPDSTVVFDFRFNSFDVNGLRRYAHKSRIEADTTQNIETLYYNAPNYSRIDVGVGTFTIDSLQISRTTQIWGSGNKRIKPTDTAYRGSIIKSNSTSTLKPLISVLDSGPRLFNLLLMGNSRQNGYGFHGYRSSGTSTLGGYGAYWVNAAFNGKDGFNLQGADGVLLFEPESFGNKGWGIKFTSPAGNSPASGTGTENGTTNGVIAGRTRSNGSDADGGGMLVYQNAAAWRIGHQAIQDTGKYNVRVYDSARNTFINTDDEFVIPRLNTTGQPVGGWHLEEVRDFTSIGGYIGSDYSVLSAASADAGTNTTVVVDDAIPVAPTNYYVNFTLKNATRSNAERLITASTNTSPVQLTLASAITSQTSTDTYSLRRVPNRGILFDRVNSAVVMNTAISSTADTTALASVRANLISINNQNFTPRTDAKSIVHGTFTADVGTTTTQIVDAGLPAVASDYWNGVTVTNNTVGITVKATDYDSTTKMITHPTIAGQVAGNSYTLTASFNWLNIALDHFDTDGNAIIDAHTKLYLKTVADQLYIQSGLGLELNAEEEIDIQPDGAANVRFFQSVADGEVPEIRIRGDVNAGAGLNSQYISIGSSASTSNTISFNNSNDSLKAAFGMILRLTGQNQTERQMEFQNHSVATSITRPSSGFVKLYTRNDTLYALPQTGTEKNLFLAASAGGAPSTSGYWTKTSDAGLSNELAMGGLATGIVKVWNTTGNASSITTMVGLDTAITTLDLSGATTGNTIVLRASGIWVDSTLAGGGGAPSTATYITQTADGTLSAEQALGALATGVLASTTTTGVVASRTLTGTAGAVTVTNGDGSANPTFTLPVAITVPTSYAIGSDPADAGVVRLENAAVIGWEASPAGTDVTLTVDASEIMQTSGAFNSGAAITEVGNSVPNSTDHLGFFAATTSAQVAGVVSDETGSGAIVFGTSPTITTSLAQDGDVADAGYFRLQNAANIAWEASPAGTDVTLGVDASEILQSSTTLNATALTEATNAVPNATDHLGFFAATTSAQILGVISDESGSGAVLGATSPSITTPSISGSVAMASGSAFNFNTGDVTVTHSADALTVVGGDVVVPTEVYDATGWNGDNSVPTKDAVRDKIETISGGSSFDPSTTYERFEDWEAGTTSTSGSMGSDWIRVITTSGTTSKEAGEAGAPGIMRTFCANSAGSTASLHTDTDTYILNGPYVVKARVRFSTLGTAGSNGAYHRVGFMDDMVAAMPTDGAWIEFNVDSSATRWRAVTANGGTRTITTDGVLTVAAATWYKLTITPNAGATSIVFAIDGTTIATHTTNIPTGAVGLSLVSAAVTASATKFMSNDYIWIKNSSMSR